MPIEEESEHLLAQRWRLLLMLGVGVLLLGTILWWNSGRKPGIAGSWSRANCQRMYQAARTRAESLGVDLEPSSPLRERAFGYLRPDARCGEVRYYDSVRVP